MIDPFAITNFCRTKNETEEFLVFCLMVANKPAKRTAILVEQLLNSVPGNFSPFVKIKHLIRDGKLLVTLKELRTGQYSRISKGLEQLVHANLDLKTCSVDDLEKIHGIGQKSSRFFLLHSRKDQKLAVLDTHILRFLREEEKLPNVPKSTPSGRKYKQLERAFISCAEKINVSIADLDLRIWSKYATK